MIILFLDIRYISLIENIMTALPVLTGVNPTIGSLAGGSVITLWGKHLDTVRKVYFGVTEATSFTINTDHPSQIIAVCPPAVLPGQVDLTVTNHNGSSNAIKFTYVDRPMITNVSPTSGSATGGTVVVLQGSNFISTHQVMFGSLMAAYYEVSSNTQIIAITPPFGNLLSTSLTVTNLAGTSQAVPFAIMSSVQPLITSIDPSRGSSSGGETVTLYGSGFTSVINVNFGGTNLVPTIISDNQIEVVSPPGLSSVYVFVNNVVENSNSVIYTYINPPIISAVSPNTGSGFGSNYVTITGLSLSWTSAVNFGSQVSTQISVINDAQISVNVPPGVGTVNVSVVTPGGTSNNLTYTYVGAPQI